MLCIFLAGEKAGSFGCLKHIDVFQGRWGLVPVSASIFLEPSLPSWRETVDAAFSPAGKKERLFQVPRGEKVAFQQADRAYSPIYARHLYLFLRTRPAKAPTKGWRAWRERVRRGQPPPAATKWPFSWPNPRDFAKLIATTRQVCTRCFLTRQNKCADRKSAQNNTFE